MSRYKKQNIRFETNVCLRQADKYISIPRRRVGNGHKFSLWFLYISVWKYIKLFKEGEVITIMWRVFITNDIRSFYPKQNNNTYMCMSQHASITITLRWCPKRGFKPYIILKHMLQGDRKSLYGVSKDFPDTKGRVHVFLYFTINQG